MEVLRLFINSKECKFSFGYR